MRRPLFLPASPVRYAAWFARMDERLMVAKSAGIRARRLARATEPGNGPVIEPDVMPSGFRAFPIPRAKVPPHKAAA